jgi:hypothetical protein
VVVVEGFLSPSATNRNAGVPVDTGRRGRFDDMDLDPGLGHKIHETVDGPWASKYVNAVQ